VGPAGEKRHDLPSERYGMREGRSGAEGGGIRIKKFREGEAPLSGVLIGSCARQHSLKITGIVEGGGIVRRKKIDGPQLQRGKTLEPR